MYPLEIGIERRPESRCKWCYRCVDEKIVKTKKNPPKINRQLKSTNNSLFFTNLITEWNKKNNPHSREENYAAIHWEWIIADELMRNTKSLLCCLSLKTLETTWTYAFQTKTKVNCVQRTSRLVWCVSFRFSSDWTGFANVLSMFSCATSWMLNVLLSNNVGELKCEIMN